MKLNIMHVRYVSFSSYADKLFIKTANRGRERWPLDQQVRDERHPFERIGWILSPTFYQDTERDGGRPNRRHDVALLAGCHKLDTNTNRWKLSSRCQFVGSAR